MASILYIGGTGTISAACVRRSIAQGHEVTVLNRGTARRPLPGLGWLRSMGRYSYEIYLTHMFVVFALVGAFRAAGEDLRGGFWWHLPAVLSCWLLGALVARYFSDPCERALRRRWLEREPVATAQDRVASN